MGFVRNVTNDGAPKTIFNVSDDQEAAAYQSLLDSDLPTCPYCYADMKPDRDGMLFVVSNPMSQMAGFDVCTITPVCPKCHKISSLKDEFDLDPAFPTAIEVLKKARANYAALKARQANAKGGTNGKKR